MLKVALVTSAIVLTGLVANSVEACEGHDAKPKDRESQLAHAFIEGHPRSAVQKQIAALTGGKSVTGTIYNTDGSVDVKRTAQMLVTTNGKDPKVVSNSNGGVNSGPVNLVAPLANQLAPVAPVAPQQYGTPIDGMIRFIEVYTQYNVIMVPRIGPAAPNQRPTQPNP
tara:strand:- start:29 stop:532 length:504 start_codon:yes stop_codon:yes gene_type:complete